MNKYLLEILKAQSSVILPGFGSLMITNSKTGKIGFNPHLKFNDGALANFIAEKEGTDKQDAQNKVAKFIREIEAELNKGNSYDMFEFGSFSKNEDGEITFTLASSGTATNTAKKEVSNKKEADKKAKAETDKKAKAETDKKAKAEADKKARAEADEKAKAEADEKAKAEADEKAKAEADKKAKAEVDKKAKAEADEKAKAEADEKAKAEADEKAKAEADEKAEAEADEKAKAEADEKVKTEENKKANTLITDKKAHDKKSALERVLGDPDKAEELKKPKVKAESKKENLQEKNEFKPADKEIGKTEAATKALVAAGLSDKVEKQDKTKDISAKDNNEKKSAEKKQKPIVKKEKEEKPKKKRWIWLIILLLLIGGGGTSGYIFKDKLIAFFNGEDTHEDGEEKDKDDSQDESTEGTVANDELASMETDSTLESSDAVGNEDDFSEEVANEIDEEVIEEVTETPDISYTSNGGKYHLIGNAFSDGLNADNYVNQMKSQGYTAAKVLGRFDNLHLVSIQQFDTQSAAASAASKTEDGAWVFKWPK